MLCDGFRGERAGSHPDGVGVTQSRGRRETEEAENATDRGGRGRGGGSHGPNWKLAGAGPKPGRDFRSRKQEGSMHPPAFSCDGSLSTSTARSSRALVMRGAGPPASLAARGMKH